MLLTFLKKLRNYMFILLLDLIYNYLFNESNYYLHINNKCFRNFLNNNVC